MKNPPERANIPMGGRGQGGAAVVRVGMDKERNVDAICCLAKDSVCPAIQTALGHQAAGSDGE